MPRVIVIGGHTRNIGKSQLVVEVLRAFPEKRWLAAKLTQYGHLDEFVANLQDFRRHNHLQYDLIHSHYWLSGEVGRRLGERWQVPGIIMFHTLGAVKNSLGVGEA